MWGMKEVIVIPVAVGALGAILSGFEKYVAAIGTEMRVKHAQKLALLATPRNLRLVSIIVQDSVRPLTTGCCPLSQNQLEQLTTMP